MKKSLHEHLDPALLPAEYGGQLGSVDSDINQGFVQWTRERNASMKELEQYGVDLKQVPALLKSIKKEHEK